MTASTPSCSRPYIGMTVDEAVALISDAWERYQIGKNEPATIPSGEYTVRINAKHFSGEMLRRVIRDCGWCLGHQNPKLLHQVHDRAIKDLPDRESDTLGRRIETAFHGIADWLA